MQNTLMGVFTALGITLSADALLVISALLSAAAAYALARWVNGRALKRQQFKHQQELESLKQLNDDHLDQMGHAFSTLSQRALQQNNDSFLNLAKQNFEQLRIAAAGDLQSRHQSFSNLVKPIEDSIKATEEQLRKFDSTRRVSDAKLDAQISGLMEAQIHLQSETRNLSTALRRPEVRGQWGELTLRRLVELAGLSEYCDFLEQVNLTTTEGRLRPDMIINLPSERQLVIDAKTPLDAYISASEAESEEHKGKFLAQHAKQVRQHITQLASKRYWSQFEKSPDFVILFIPGDQFLSAALLQDSTLLEFALQKQVLLATPTSLVGLLRAIAYGWRQSVLSENMVELYKTGQVLTQRLNTLTEHLNKLGTNLDSTVEQFNRLVGSFQQSTLPATRRFSELGLEHESQDSTTPEHSKAPATRRVHPPTDDLQGEQ